MSDLKISELTAVTLATSADFVPVVQSGTTKRVTLQKIVDWFVTTGLTWTAAPTFNITAQTGVGETLATWKISDISTAALEFLNASVTDGLYEPLVRGTGATTLTGLHLRGAGTTDSGTNPVMIFGSRIGAATNVATRPLFAFRNNGTDTASVAASGAWTYTILSTTATAEPISAWKVSDDATAKLEIVNGSSTDGLFLPTLKGTGNAANIALLQQANGTTDTGTNPVLVFDCRIGGGTAVATRPILDLRNAGVSMVQLAALSSGASAYFSWGTTPTVAAPALTTRSTGTNLVLRSTISGTTLDYAIGAESGYVWLTSGSASANANASGVKLYGGGSTTPSHIFRADGLTDVVGAIRSTGSSANPAAGSGIEMNYNGGSGRIQAYNYTGSAWLPLALNGLTITLAPSGVTAASYATGGAATYTVAAIASTAETLATWKTADDATGKFELLNLSTTDGIFVPHLKATGNVTGAVALYLTGAAVTDTGAAAIVGFNAQTSGGAAIANRNLFGFYNNGTSLTTVSPKGAWAYTVTSTASTAETLATWSVSDDATGKLEVINWSSADGVFMPTIKGTGAGNNLPLALLGAATNDNVTTSQAAIKLDARTAAGAALTTKGLVEVTNSGTQMLGVYPLNSGASAVMVFNGSGLGAPAFTTRSAGTKLVLLSGSLDASHVDWGFGMESGAMYASIRDNTSTNSFKIYGGTSLRATFRGDGLFENTGTIRATGNATAATGSSVEVDYNSGSSGMGRIFAYDRTGSAYLGMTVDGLTVALRPGGTAALTAAASGLVGINTASPTAGIHVFGGGTLVDMLAPPAAPSTITQAGATGAVSYWYWLVGVDKAGNKTLLSTSATTALSNATLDGTNYNIVTLAASPTSLGFASIDVLRTTSSTAPTGTTTLLVGSVTGATTTKNDQSNTVSSYTVPTRNATADLVVDGSGTFADGLTITKVAQATTAETLTTWTVSDDATSKLEVFNGASADGSFVPALRGTASSTNAGLYFTATGTTDSGTIPLQIFDCRVGASTVATRPIYEWRNNSTAKMSMAAGGAMTYTVTHVDASAETLATWKLDEDTNSSLGIYNGSSSNAAFGPELRGVNSGAALPGLRITAQGGTDTGTVALGLFNARISSGTAATVRPLFDWQNNGTTMLAIAPLSSGGSAFLSWGTSPTVAAPTLTTRSGGTNLTLRATVGASTLDYGIGVETGYTWISSGSATAASSGAKFYGGGSTTAYLTARADGLVDTIGSLRATGSTAASAGAGLELFYSDPTAFVQAYDRTGSAYKTLSLRGSSILIQPSGTSKMTVDSTRVTFASCGIAFNTTVVTGAGPTTIGSTDHWTVANPTVTAAATYNLPATPVTGQEHTVTDEKGIAAANNITISGNGKNISGGTTTTTEVIATNYGSRTLRYNGTNWNIVAKV